MIVDSVVEISRSQNSYRKKEKLFLYFSYKNNFSLEVICHADKLR